jgi:hypothetical protein
MLHFALAALVAVCVISWPFVFWPFDKEGFRRALTAFPGCAGRQLMGLAADVRSCPPSFHLAGRRTGARRPQRADKCNRESGTSDNIVSRPEYCNWARRRCFG